MNWTANLAVPQGTFPKASNSQTEVRSFSICWKCGEPKQISDFYCIAGKRRRPCKDCWRRYHSEVTYPKHRRQIVNRQKLYYQSHKTEKRIYDVGYRDRKNFLRRSKYAFDDKYRRHMLEYNQARNSRHRQRHRASTNKSNQKARIELRTYYVRAALREKRKGVSLKVKDFPPELVELKRAQLQLARTIRAEKEADAK